MSVIDPPSKHVKKFLLDTPEAKVQAAAFLADGGFTTCTDPGHGSGLQQGGG